VIVRRAFSTGHRDDSHAGDIVAAVDADNLGAHDRPISCASIVVGCVCQRSERKRLSISLHGCSMNSADAAARTRDQRRKAAADIEMQAHRRWGARSVTTDMWIEVGHLEPIAVRSYALERSASLGCTGSRSLSPDGASQAEECRRPGCSAWSWVDLSPADPTPARAGWQARARHRTSAPGR